MAEQKDSEKAGTQNGAYASETIATCMGIVSQIFNAKGDGYVTREEICAIVGKAEGTMIMRIAACVHYGLLQNHHGKGYQVTELAAAILKPEFGDTTVRKKSLEAFNNVGLYKKLIERYNSKALPDKKGLSNILTEYGINANSTTRAASIFLENCSDLAIVENGRLRYFIPGDGIAHTGSGGQGSEELVPKNPPVELPKPPDPKMFELPIDLGSKTAVLKYPRDITPEEIAIMKIMVDATLAALAARHKANV